QWSPGCFAPFLAVVGAGFFLRAACATRATHRDRPSSRRRTKLLRPFYPDLAGKRAQNETGHCDAFALQEKSSVRFWWSFGCHPFFIGPLAERHRFNVHKRGRWNREF